MKHTLMMGAVAMAMTVGAIVNVAADEQNHSKPGHQHRSEKYEQGKVEKEAEKVAEIAPAEGASDGKRLPGRDCKLNEGGTRQHTFPAYEIGNADRPECPPETK